MPMARQSLIIMQLIAIMVSLGSNKCCPWKEMVEVVLGFLAALISIWLQDVRVLPCCDILALDQPCSQVSYGI